MNPQYQSNEKPFSLTSMLDELIASVEKAQNDERLAQETALRAIVRNEIEKAMPRITEQVIQRIVRQLRLAQ